MRVTKKLKDVPETFRSIRIRIKSTIKRRKSFLYLIRSKTGIQLSFKNKEIEV